MLFLSKTKEILEKNTKKIGDYWRLLGVKYLNTSYLMQVIAMAIQKENSAIACILETITDSRYKKLQKGIFGIRENM